ncbi:GNAT family N-acetyltransferase [Cellulomonas fimi]|uniref:GCN5-related N-acetyltransferase n=1 Tax=Cellulomonas fimi (strain ATCC 484 / DSM 20113 / JCM 1341 / CCUG 24087 / LMG 16345 / NBRC 15513 / NCIMB 8980 / NCTC 7547 / NRS-133) TaxID=590998 RepID=F4H0J2_CELFA|nr:GNAT family N-acetyltransferase [Cellulomonas fimi]AEE47361.1 GCN5-related N-acetyltransferase [Cellulomonas fimi ATCC 484]NNH05809.1 GNAT family N-acetyltransferase [Cellulomonas fimi]VEH36025.1 putative acetyltransferase [Cellulomonas fimi]
MTGDGGRTVTLRDARPDDAPRLAEIWSTGWLDAHDGRVPDALAAHRTPQSFVERAPGVVRHTRVAEVAGTVVGFAATVDDHVDQLYVDASARGTGVAAALLADAARVAAEAGHVQPWLAVVPGNERARRFYERQGWSDEGPFDLRVDVAPGVGVDVPCRRYRLAGPGPSAADG